MQPGFRPVGAALPPRRDSLVQAAAAPAAPGGSDWGTSINVPLARDRMLEYFEREQLPGEELLIVEPEYQNIWSVAKVCHIHQ
jgi:hypothetical protein